MSLINSFDPDPFVSYENNNLSVNYEYQYRQLHQSASDLRLECQAIECFRGTCNSQSSIGSQEGYQKSGAGCTGLIRFDQLNKGDTGDIIVSYEIPGAPSHKEYYQVEVSIELD